MRRTTARRVIAGAALFVVVLPGGASAEPAAPAPDIAEPAAGRPSDPPRQGEYRSDPAQEGADRGQFIANRARTSETGVGDEVTNNQSGEGTAYCVTE